MYRDVDKMSVRTAFGQLNRPWTVFSTCFDWDHFTQAKNTRHNQIVGQLTTQIDKKLRSKKKKNRLFSSYVSEHLPQINVFLFLIWMIIELKSP